MRSTTLTSEGSQVRTLLRPPAKTTPRHPAIPRRAIGVPLALGLVALVVGLARWIMALIESAMRRPTNHEPQRFPDVPGEWPTGPDGVVVLAEGEELVIGGSPVSGRHSFGVIPERGA
jgi:hypothetical protein